MITKRSIWFLLLFPFPAFSSAGAVLNAVEWFPEPSGLRIVNQSELTGVIRNVSSNIDVTQIFTISASGSVSAIGIALGGAAGISSLTTSLYRVSNDVVQASAFATSLRLADYFADIGPQTVPVWAYAEFSTLAPIIAGEQIAFRIQSPSAELWGPGKDVLPDAGLVEIPGTDLAFRVYVTRAELSLSFKNVGTNLVLGWPSSVTNGAVEVTASLPDLMSWKPLHTITAMTNQYGASIEPGAKFFRLRIP